MNVLIDTPIWSLAFRRRENNTSDQLLVHELTELIRETRAIMLGPIRQEILSGISRIAQFEKVKKNLVAFDDQEIQTADFERAAQMFNICRKKGIQGSHTDFLLCAVAERYQASIFTTDGDFEHYAKHISVTLHIPRIGS